MVNLSVLGVFKSSLFVGSLGALTATTVVDVVENNYALLDKLADFGLTGIVLYIAMEQNGKKLDRISDKLDTFNTNLTQLNRELYETKQARRRTDTTL